MILRRARELRENDDFKSIYISPDLTRKQQQIDQDLRDNLRRLKAEGDNTDDIKIRQGKVVKYVKGNRPQILYQPAMESKLAMSQPATAVQS